MRDVPGLKPVLDFTRLVRDMKELNAVSRKGAL